MSKPSKLGNKWRVRWIDGEGRRRSEVYLKHGDAVKALARHQVEAERVKREGPVQRRDHTFEELADRWEKYRLPEKRSAKTDLSLLKVHLRPTFAGVRLRDITPGHVEEFKAARRHLTENTVNHSLGLLRTMLGYAHDLGWIDKIPKVQKYRLRVEEFSYLKTPDEVRRFLAAASERRQPIPILYQAAIQTGLRCGELCGLRWDDVDFEGRLITVRRSYDGPTKNGEVRHVPILDGLLMPLKAWKLECPRSEKNLVFPNHRGVMHRRESRIFQEVLHQVLEAAGLGRGYITFHDLRHSFASHWMMNRGDLFRLQKILGHRDPMMTQRYAHLAPGIFTEDHGRLAGLAVGQAAIATIGTPGNEDRTAGFTPSVARSDGSPDRLAR